MSIEIQWIHHASFRLSAGATVVYIDPWKLLGEPKDATVVFVSHGHYDHCSPDDVAKVSTPETQVLGPPDTADQFPGGQVLQPGQHADVAGVTIDAVGAYNLAKQFHPKGNGWLGAVIALGGVRVYYAGDTDLIPEMSDLADVDVALLPVGGTYTMDAAEAARACEAIGPTAAVPYHWGDIVGNAGDAQQFAQAAGCTVHVLTPGQSLTV